MSFQSEFESLFETLKTERDEVLLKLHLASMDAKDEFIEAEQKWEELKVKAAEIGDETKETSDEFVAKANIVREELKEAYHRIKERF